MSSSIAVQQDSQVRVMALENLKATCSRASGIAHRYHVKSVTRSRVHIEYSNPDEYGRARPLTAVFPCYPAYGNDKNPLVVLDVMRVVGSTDSEDWQHFIAIVDAPMLWRHPETGRWYTEKELKELAGQLADTDVSDSDGLAPTADVPDVDGVGECNECYGTLAAEHVVCCPCGMEICGTCAEHSAHKTHIEADEVA